MGTVGSGAGIPVVGIPLHFLRSQPRRPLHFGQGSRVVVRGAAGVVESCAFRDPDNSARDEFYVRLDDGRVVRAFGADLAHLTTLDEREAASRFLDHGKSGGPA